MVKTIEARIPVGWWITASGLVLLLSGCATSGVSSLRTELDDLRLQNQELSERLEVLEEQRTGDQAEVSNLEQRLEEESTRVDILVEKLSTQPTAAAAPRDGGRTGRTAPPPSFDPGIMWEEGQAAALEGRYADAILRLEELVALYPRHELVDDARTLIGNCYYDQGDFARALEHYVRVVTENPEGDQFAAAALRAAFAYEKLGEADNARAVLEEVVRRFPGSQEALRAEERLRLMPPISSGGGG